MGLSGFLFVQNSILVDRGNIKCLADQAMGNTKMTSLHINVEEKNGTEKKMREATNAFKTLAGVKSTNME